jgi:Ca2+/Na+ antiporter
MADAARKRNPLTPWYIGIVFLLITDAIFFYVVMTQKCEIPNPIVLGIMVVLPALYLVLMYLAFRSQD